MQCYLNSYLKLQIFSIKKKVAENSIFEVNIIEIITNVYFFFQLTKKKKKAQ